MRYTFLYKNEEKSIMIKKELENKLKGEYDEINPDFVFTIGGDGTVLDAVKKYLNIIDKVVFVTIHTGKLGFYTEFLPNEIDLILNLINDYDLNLYHLINYQINDDVVYALNEITITDQHRLFEADIYIDDNYLMHVRGNGICISTPTGSTAYNKSVGGAVLNPEMKALQLSLIAPFESVNNKMLSPLVLTNEVIKVKPNNKYVDITADRHWLSKEDVKEIEIKLANKTVKFMKNKSRNFIKRLNEKFIGK